MSGLNLALMSSVGKVLKLFATMCLDKNKKLKLFYYSIYFCYYSWTSLHFLVLFIGFTVLFQLTFTFIYNIFSNKFSISAK